MKTKTKKKKLPDFDKMSIEEEAIWWETTDLSEFGNEFSEGEPFKIEPGALDVSKRLRDLSNRLVASNLESGIHVRLTPLAHNKLRAAARRRGMGLATLARMWILQGLRAGEKVTTRSQA